MKRWLWIVGIVVVAGVVGLWSWRGRSTPTESYIEGKVARGDLRSTITSTGTLYPKSQVEVGTQVSGTIAKVFVDFNDHVRKGQLLAVLDTLLLQTSVQEAKADVAAAKAQLEQDRTDFARQDTLRSRNLVSEETYLAAKVKAQTQAASLVSAEARLTRAKTSLENAVIRSPISGTVIQRNVEAGQTVAASLSAPTLFIIAEDLGSMEIHAAVDESDVGQVHNGQTVTFTVQAYPEANFDGTVRMVRLQPTTDNNVVNYTVIVDAPNPDGRLLPGMTATVDFVVADRKDVLMVPNAALRFQPTPEMIAMLRKRRAGGDGPGTAQAHAAGGAGGARGARGGWNGGGRPGGGMGGGGAWGGGPGGKRPKDVAMLWYRNEKGEIAVERVRTGVTDGRNTEITARPPVTEGTVVLLGSTGTSAQGANRPHFHRGLF